MRKFTQFTFMILMLALVSLVASASAQAQTVDPATLFPSTCAQTTCNFLYLSGTEVVGVNAGSITLFLNGKGQSIPSTGQLLLIIGIPNPPGGSAPNINGINGSTLGTPITASLVGSLTSGSVYDVFTPNLPGDAANSFTNWSGADCAVDSICGITSFSIYEYVLSGNALNGLGTLTIDFSGSGLSQGTFVVGWGCSDTSSACSTGTPYSTPFTQAGLVVSTPEPSAVEFFGLSLLMIGGAVKWRTKSV